MFLGYVPRIHDHAGHKLILALLHQANVNRTSARWRHLSLRAQHAPPRTNVREEFRASAGSAPAAKTPAKQPTATLKPSVQARIVPAVSVELDHVATSLLRTSVMFATMLGTVLDRTTTPIETCLIAALLNPTRESAAAGEPSVSQVMVLALGVRLLCVSQVSKR
jgi:hypothetical protein